MEENKFRRSLSLTSSTSLSSSLSFSTTSLNGSSRSARGTPPGSPSKLHSEYRARLGTPTKRRMSHELYESLTPKSCKNALSPVSLTRHSSDGAIYSDRFIPSRSASQMDIAYTMKDTKKPTADSNKILSPLASYPVLPTTTTNDDSTSSSTDAPTGAGDVESSRNNAGNSSNHGSQNHSSRDGQQQQSLLNILLKSELLGAEYVSSGSGSRSSSNGGGSFSRGSKAGSRDADDSAMGSYMASAAAVNHLRQSEPNLLKFKSPRERLTEEMNQSLSNILHVGSASRLLLSTPRKAKRKISKVPFKILDAPALQDDFYLNLVDWSSQNVLAVGLGSCVYLWSACTSKVTKLCDLGLEDCVTSVAWSGRGSHLAVGTNQGEVQLWETSQCRKVRSLGGHSARIGTMGWNGQVLASGGRDRLIYLRDVRMREAYVNKLQGHKQEVCGLRWSFDDNQLASGGNDNKLLLWSLHSTTPLQRYSEHTAAVKALAWSPHQHGLLASGGGTADRCIRFYNTLTGASLDCIDTGSQVCNLVWSKNINEIVSTHGYSLNQIIVWKYPSMSKVATLTGHTYRVLYLACSPDGQTIVTGAGDETLRFWNVFPSGSKAHDRSRLGPTGENNVLFPTGIDIR